MATDLPADNPALQAHPDEPHRGGIAQRLNWLRAGVLGANDGIVSVAAIVVGVAGATTATGPILTAGLAGLVGGAMSMAAGEYVSVQSQADAEHADLAIERRELHEDPHDELEELAGIYRRRGLSPELAHEVAVQLTAHDALAAHARDELGITDELRARPLQAAAASASAFVAGAALPVLTALLAPAPLVTTATIVSTLVGLSITGALAAHAGGATPIRGAVRVVFWGALAMAAATAIGRLFHIVP